MKKIISYTAVLTLCLLLLGCTAAAKIEESSSQIEKNYDVTLMNKLEEKFVAIKNGKGVSFAVPLSSVIGVNLYQFLSDNRMGRDV